MDGGNKHPRLPIRLYHGDTKENQWPPDTHAAMKSCPSDTSNAVVSKSRDRDTNKNRQHSYNRHARTGDEVSAGGQFSMLERMHSKFQAEIDQSEELDDPLDVYHRYAQWIVDAYSTTETSSASGTGQQDHYRQQHSHNPNIGRESGLFGLLEKSIRTFKDAKRYRNDVRFLNLNIMYIQMIKDPLTMFNYLMNSGIGSELAKFYEEYAAYLEGAGDGYKAIEIMRIGIEREAQPIERLKRRFQLLLNRINQTTDRSLEAISSSARTGRISDIQPHDQPPILAAKSEAATTSKSISSSIGAKTITKLSVYADPSTEKPQQEVKSVTTTDTTSSSGAGGRRSLPLPLPLPGRHPFPVTIGASGRKECLMIDLMAVYADSSEWQPDELRARQARYGWPTPTSEASVRPPSRSLIGSSSSHVLSTKMSLSRENTLDFSIRIKNGLSSSSQDVQQGERTEMARTPPPLRHPSEADLIPRTPPERVVHAFGTTLVPRVELTPGESRKRSLSRNYIASSPTLHSKSALAEMNKIFSDRSRLSQGSTYWSGDDYHEDNTITRSRFSEFGVSSESEQDLEGGSTMTREIQALKRQRANEAGDHADVFDRRASQISVGSRTSTSDITRAIEARGGIVSSQESRSRASLSKPAGGIELPSRLSFPSAAEPASFRTSLSATSHPSLSWAKQPSAFTSAAAAAPSTQHPSTTKKPRRKVFEVFRDDHDQDTPDLAESSEVPALGDEEPPSQLDVHGEDDLRDLSWQAESSDLGDYSGIQQYLQKNSPADHLTTGTLSKHSALSAPMLSESKPQSSLTSLFQRSTSSKSLGTMLRSTTVTHSQQRSAKTIAQPTKAILPQQPSPPRIQELQSLFSPAKSKLAPAISTDKHEDKPSRLSTSRLSGGKTVQMQRPLFSNPCFPGSQRVRSTILGRLIPGLKSYIGYHEDLEFIMEQHLRIERSAKRAEKGLSSRHNSGGASSTNSNISNGSSSSSGNGGRGYQLGWSAPNTESETIQLGQESFSILKKVGEGGYAKVYGVEANGDLDQQQHQIRHGSFGSRARANSISSATWRMLALKLERPSNAWEFYILSQIHKRFQAAGLLRIRGSVIQPLSFYRFKDESYLIMEYCSHGTLLDAINVCRKRTTSGAMDESLVLFFTIELLRVLEGLHVKGFVHGDLKADNCMVRFDSHDRVDASHGADSQRVTATSLSSGVASGLAPATTALQSSYDPNGGGGWSRCGVKLIDFGRAVDLTQFDRDMEFRADWPIDAQDCPEIRAEQPWRFQPDYFGLAKVVFTMLTGQEDMPTSEGLASEVLDLSDASGGRRATSTSPVFDERRYRVSDKEPPDTFVFVVPNDGNSRRQRLDYTLRRYWKQELWRPMFDILLNPSLYRPADRSWEPCTAALAQVRAWMQQHLSRQRADEPRGVRKLLAQLEVLLVEQQKIKSSAR